MHSFRIPSAEDIERLAEAAGMAMTTIFERAGIAPSTFYRWRSGSSIMKVDTVQRLLAAITPKNMKV